MVKRFKTSKNKLIQKLRKESLVIEMKQATKDDIRVDE
jgi:hypothetical protein